MGWVIWRAARNSRPWRMASNSSRALRFSMDDARTVLVFFVVVLARCAGAVFRRGGEHRFGCLPDVFRACFFPWRRIAFLEDACGAVGQCKCFDHLLHGLLKRVGAQIV